MLVQCFRPSFILFIFLLFQILPGKAQYITSIAGTGIWGYTGDGGPATAAEISGPLSIWIDTINEVIFADDAHCRIRKIDTNGIISTIAGTGTAASTGNGGPASAASLSAPVSVVMDRAGNLFFNERSAHFIRKIDRYGIVSIYAGTGTGGYSGDGGPATAADISTPGILTVDTSGNLFFTNAAASVVRRISTIGIITTVAGTGVIGYSGDGGPATLAQLNGTQSIATDKHGNLLIADLANYRIRKVDTSGIISTIAGTGVFGFSGDGGPASAAEITEVQSIYVDDADNILLSDLQNDRVRLIAPSGIISTIAGGGSGGLGDGGPATSATLASPYGVIRKGNGNIYIADVRNDRIRMLVTRPFYVNGPVQHINFCGTTTYNLDTALAANDSNSGNRETWQLLSGPYHGTASIGYHTTSTGGTLYPIGQSYTAHAGYTGADTLVVVVTDSVISDTTTLYLNVEGAARAGVISGPDTVCRPGSIVLTDTATGGVWSASNGHATVTGGVVTGVSSGPDTIRYVVTNACGPASASLVVAVKGCLVAVPELEQPGIAVYPNPCDGVCVVSGPVTTEAMWLRLTDLMGRELWRKAYSGTDMELALPVPPGLYLLWLEGPGQRWSTRLAVMK